MDVATEGGSRTRLRGAAVMIILMDKSMKDTLPVQAMGPAPATSFLEDKVHSPLFTMILAKLRCAVRGLLSGA